MRPTGEHFYTVSAQERDNAIATTGYVSEGIACWVPGTTPLFRMFNGGNGDHFYTTSVQERDNAVANGGYTDEGVACQVFAATQPGTTPLFRMFNFGNGDHFYTTSATERNNAVLNPLALLVPPVGTIPINQMLQSMQQTYAQVNILVEVGSTQNLGLPDLVDVPPGSSQQTQLFTNRDSVGMSDIAVYFVRTAGGFNGFAPLGLPSAVVASIASPWTLAHEVGHSLNLNHIPGESTSCPPGTTCCTADFTRLMTGCGTNNIINPPPDLTAAEVTVMDSRGETVDI